MRLLLSVILVCLLPFVLLVFFVHPSLDDFALAINLRELGASRLELFAGLMQHWNGRYTSNFLAVAAPLTFDSLLGYRLALMLQFPALYFSLFYFLRALLQQGADSAIGTSEIHLFSASWLLIYLNLLPDITETIYWLSGAKVYTWALIVQLIVLGLMISTEKKPGVWKSLSVAGLMFILCGFNEIVLAINMIIALGYLFWPFGRGAFQKYAAPFSLQRILPALGVLLSAIIVLTSPGNEGRLWHFPEGGNLGTTFRIAMLSGAKLVGVMLQSVPLLLAGFLCLPHLKATHLPAFLRPLACWSPVLVLVAAFLFFFASLAVPAWAMGINPPMRVYNFLGMYFMGFFFWFLFSFREWVHIKGVTFFPAFHGVGKWIVLSLIFIAMAGDFHKEPGPDGPFTYRGNLARVVSDLVFRAVPYSRAMQERESIIRHQKAIGNYHVTVPSMHNPPGSILYLDITADKNHPVNAVQARWYGLESLAVSPQNPASQ